MGDIRSWSRYFSIAVTQDLELNVNIFAALEGSISWIDKIDSQSDSESRITKLNQRSQWLIESLRINILEVVTSSEIISSCNIFSANTTCISFHIFIHSVVKVLISTLPTFNNTDSCSSFPSRPWVFIKDNNFLILRGKCNITARTSSCSSFFCKNPSCLLIWWKIRISTCMNLSRTNIFRIPS